MKTVGHWSYLTGQPEISNLEEGMDFRLPQYRREVFLRFYEFHLKYRSHPGGVYYLFPYLADALHMNWENKLWFAYINGCSQHPVTTYLIFKQHSHPEAIGKWFEENYTRFRWDNDRRHHKTMFPRCVQDYLEKLNGGTQLDFFRSLCDSKDEGENFRRVWETVKGTFLSFGRLSTFSYLEYLRIMDLPLDCNDLFLEDLEGSKSHRNGLAKVLGRDDLDWHQSNSGFEGYTPEQISWLKEEAVLLLEEAKSRFRDRPFYRDVSFFTLESTLCCYKSWHRPNRRYPNVYNDMLCDRIRKMEAAWPEEDFSLFWQARQEALPRYLRLEDNPWDVGLKPLKMNHYLQTGEPVMMDEEWSCFRNSYRREP